MKKLGRRSLLGTEEEPQRLDMILRIKVKSSSGINGVGPYQYSHTDRKCCLYQLVSSKGLWMMKAIQRANFAGQVLSRLSFQSQMTIHPQKPAKCVKVINTCTHVGVFVAACCYGYFTSQCIDVAQLAPKSKSAKHWVQWYTLQRLTLSNLLMRPKGQNSCPGYVELWPNGGCHFFPQTFSLALHSIT